MGKEQVVNILTPILYRTLTRVLMQLKPLFLAEDDALCQQLKSKDFHPALCAHPSILFGHRIEHKEQSVAFLSAKVAYLREAIRLGLLKSEKGKAIIGQFGISQYFARTDFWFVESSFPILPYNTPKQDLGEHKIAVYSALTGDYDFVNEILYKEDGVDYILFTNNKNINSNTWQVKYVDSDSDNVLLSREIKMLPHKYLGDKYDVSIYIDANAVIYGELTQLVGFLQEGISFAVSKHGERSSVKEEIEIIIARMRHIDPQAANAQYERYLAEGYKDDKGLAECSILVRRHNEPKVKEVMDAWWNEFRTGIRRDQVSLLPCISRMHFDEYVIMNGYVRHNQYCKIIPHK